MDRQGGGEAGKGGGMVRAVVIEAGETDMFRDCVAQWIAHLTSNQGVVGSSPIAVDSPGALRRVAWLQCSPLAWRV